MGKAAVVCGQLEAAGTQHFHGYSVSAGYSQVASDTRSLPLLSPVLPCLPADTPLAVLAPVPPCPMHVYVHTECAYVHLGAA